MLKACGVALFDAIDLREAKARLIRYSAAMQKNEVKQRYNKILSLSLPLLALLVIQPTTTHSELKQRETIGPGSIVNHSSPPFVLSHAWIVVTTGAPERSALEKAGFRIAPTVNRHDGQGTASISVELLNGFLELIYPDSTVPVSPRLQAGAEKFRLKSAWRESGYSPIGVVFDRTAATPEKFPFATWKITADWMEAGTFIEMLTPRELPKAVSLSISSHPESTRTSENEKLANDPVKGAMFLHPNGARRLTGLRVVAPNADALPPAAKYIADHQLVKFEIGKNWLLAVTLDNGRQGIIKNLEPTLPMTIRY